MPHSSGRSLSDHLLEGQVIPAHPLALDAELRLDERYQRALTRYYLASGAGGLAVGVHTTQFEIRAHDLFRPVLELASETIDAHLVGDDTVVSLKPSFLLDGLGAVHSEFVRISFTKTENPNKPGPVLITSQSSREAPGSDNYKYLLQPNLLLR